MRLVSFLAMVLMVALLSTGCEERFFQPDIEPPLSPEGISTRTGNNLVEVSWNRNREPDLAGYHVYVSSSYNGVYTKIGSSRVAYFADSGSRNGRTYYYAVSAFDRNGNESELSADVAYETPRPEGYDVGLGNYRVSPTVAGYDFSTKSIGRYDDQFTDFYFEYSDGIYYLDVWEDTDIQDMGYTNSLYEIGEAPTKGWSPTKDVRLIPGHTYVVWTWDNHFAKVRIIEVSPLGVKFDWAYQLQEGNTRLKSVSHRGELIAGSGVRMRP